MKCKTKKQKKTKKKQKKQKKIFLPLILFLFRNSFFVYNFKMIWNTSFLVKYTQPNDRQCLFFIQLLRNIIFIWFSSAMSLFIIWLRTKFFNCRFIGRVAKSIDQLSKNECMISSIWPLLFSKSVNLLCACNFAHSSFL